MIEQNGKILTVNDLKTYFQTEDGVVKAVDGITFTLEKGETSASSANREAENR